jgi:hypothetical protein
MRLLLIVEKVGMGSLQAEDSLIKGLLLSLLQVPDLGAGSKRVRDP